MGSLDFGHADTRDGGAEGPVGRQGRLPEGNRKATLGAPRRNAIQSNLLPAGMEPLTVCVKTVHQFELHASENMSTVTSARVCLLWHFCHFDSGVTLYMVARPAAPFPQILQIPGGPCFVAIP